MWKAQIPQKFYLALGRRTLINGTRRARDYSMKRSQVTQSSTDRKLTEEVTANTRHPSETEKGDWRQNSLVMDLNANTRAISMAKGRAEAS